VRIDQIAKSPSPLVLSHSQLACSLTPSVSAGAAACMESVNTLHARPRERRRHLEAPLQLGHPLFSFPWLWPHVSCRHLLSCSTDPLRPVHTARPDDAADFSLGLGRIAHSQPVHLHHSGPPGVPDRPGGAGEVVLRQCGRDSSWHRHASS